MPARRADSRRISRMDRPIPIGWLFTPDQVDAAISAIRPSERPPTTNPNSSGLEGHILKTRRAGTSDLG